MPSNIAISVNLGAGYAGVSLCAQLIKTSGANVTPLISDGFIEIGEGFYLWEYNNVPENFRGGVKFYDQNDTSKVLSFIDITNEDSLCCANNECCVGEIDTVFDITYSDQPALTLYALLFSAEDLDKAWKPSTGTFETYTLATQTDFVLPLVEDSERLGFYEYIITDVSNIPPVVGNQYYYLEVWQRKGATPNRSVDLNTGTLRVCWGKEQGDWLEIARKVWEYGTRTLTSSAITPQQIWEYANRTLTAGGVVDCDFTALQQAILIAISISTGKTLDELARVDKELGNSIQKTFELLQTCCANKPKGSPIVQTPRIGPRGSKGRGSDMRFQ